MRVKKLICAILILLIAAALFAGKTSTGSIFAFGKLNRSIERFSYVNFKANGKDINDKGMIYLPESIVGETPLDAQPVFEWNFRGNIYSPTVGTRTYTTMYLTFTIHGLENSEGRVLNYYYLFDPEDTYYDSAAPAVAESLDVSARGGASIDGDMVYGYTTDSRTDVMARFAYTVSYEGREPDEVWNRPGRFYMYIPKENVKVSSGEYTGEVFVTISVE